MNRFADRIEPFVTAELEAAREAEDRGCPAKAFAYLERAHVLGQASTAQHVRVHWRMLRWGLRHRRPQEIGGQLLRIVGAATKTAIGWVPEGNSGGADVSPFKPMPTAPDLQAVIQRAKER